MRGEERSRMRRKSFTATSLHSSYRMCPGWQMAATAKSATLHSVPLAISLLPFLSFPKILAFPPLSSSLPPPPQPSSRPLPLPSPTKSPLTPLPPLSALPPPPHPPTARRDNLAHPNLPRLLPLPHQSLESIHPQPNAETDGRFPAGAESSTARERGAGEEDGERADI